MSEHIEYGQGEDPNLMGGNIVQLIECPTLGQFNLGRGSIGAEDRLDLTSPENQAMLERIKDGEFHREVSDTLPVICIDGRFDKDGRRIDGPASAGATAGLAYAKDLSASSLQPAAEKEVDLIGSTVSKLSQAGHRTSVHGDNHGPCGCGACAKAPEIYGEIAKGADSIHAAVAALGFTLSSEQKAAMTARAQERVNNNFFAADRKEVLDKAEEAGAEYEGLVDAHLEQLIIMNTQSGTRIDTAAIREALGIEVFVVDAWAFAGAAEAMNETGFSEEIDATTKALAVYNVATADALCAPSMPILVV